MFKKRTVFTPIVVAAVSLFLFSGCSQKKESQKNDANAPAVQEAIPAAQQPTQSPPATEDALESGSTAETATVDTSATADAPLSDTSAKQPKKKGVVALSGLDTVTSIVEGTPGQLLVFDLYADWCVPCKILAPMYDSLAHIHHQNANFYRIDVQRNPDIAAAFGVRGIPLVVFMKDKEVVQAVTGLNPRTSYERILTSCGAEVSIEECRENLKKAM